MSDKKKVYVETSVISNLTARPSSRVVEAGRQIATIEWWERATQEYELYGSFVVEREAARGDAEAASRRLEKLRDLKSAVFDDRAIILAEALLSDTAVPRNSYDDALHIATAAINEMEFLVTWNCKHIANAVTRPVIRKTCERMGYVCPEICTPDEL